MKMWDNLSTRGFLLNGTTQQHIYTTLGGVVGHIVQMCSTVLRVVLKADETKYLALSNGLVFDSLKHKKEYLQDF